MTRLLYGLCGEDRARRFSPHVWKVEMALAHKGLDCRVVPLAFTEIPEVEGGATKTVPYLVDGDHAVVDSFAIAQHLDAAYPDRATLFGGDGGRATARFVEAFSQTVLHPAIIRIILLDVHDRLAPRDRAYFRTSREAAFGKTLEEVAAAGPAERSAFADKLMPLRSLLRKQPFIGGDTPLFADYIVFGALQWARIISPQPLLDPLDAVADWFERCLDLHGGLGRGMPAAGTAEAA
ncbi:beta-aryl ether-cleaving protein [Rhizobium sp. Leaf384]|uniref:glutathione S-transferase family protein n=1 Tax=unclassified Rhizobium TaxID=2613769 RepID=UPI000715D0C7|nr:MULTISPECIES: glutathione S-transferase family protein [unclassified Rhizobium]KQS80486.1 beta-aryl ether-cleaving protein [Rhizobium sp. Leaf384]KQS86536.1 beta-aryl ether-cleaving protein [Rhizobium sp. Leaf383]